MYHKNNEVILYPAKKMPIENRIQDKKYGPLSIYGAIKWPNYGSYTFVPVANYYICHITN